MDRALLAASRGLKKTIKQINADAGKTLARGDYERADEAVALARTLAAFGSELAALDQKWHSVSDSIVSSKGKQERVPLWTQYKPILRALADLGGEATRPELAAQLAKSPVAVPSNVLGRARRAMIGEGFIDGSRKGSWKITEDGRKAAKS